MPIDWEARLDDTEQFGFSQSKTYDTFGYYFPLNSKDQINLICTKCNSTTAWAVGDFYSKLLMHERQYTCRSCKKYSLDDVQQKIDDIFGQGLITIAPNQTYTGIRDPLKFIDRDYGEWTSAAFNIITNKNTHPKRSVERRKQTNLAKYGHENAFGSEQIKEKIKRVNLEKYGFENPMQNKEVKEKLKNTFIEKYGCAVPLVGNDEVLKKVKTTNIERYGVENPSHSTQIQQEKENTNLDRYGFKTPLQNTEVKEKIKATNNERLGVDYPTQSDSVKERIRLVCQEKYGYDYPLQHPDILEKQRQTNQLRYGVNCYKQLGCPRLPNGLLMSEYLLLHNSNLWPTSCMYVWKEYGFDRLREHVENKIPFGKETALESTFATTYGLPIHKKRLINGNFPDFKLTETTYVDIDGLYWHSEAVKKDKWYHYKKRKRYEAEGFRLVQFRADEFRDKPNIIQSILNNILNKNIVSIGARKCKICEVTWGDAKVFLAANHLQGVGSNARCLGLYHDNLLVMLICLRENPQYGVGTFEISRLCTLLNHRIQGGFSRLLKAIESQYAPTRLISWCDLRYATGAGYEKVGFSKDKKDILSWCWTDFSTTFNRRTCRANMDNRGLTEKEHALELGLFRIYDAGQRLYTKEYLSHICKG